MRDQASIATIVPGHSFHRPGGGLGKLDDLPGRPVAPDVDQRGDDAGTWISQALAFRARYAGQSRIAAAGAAGAVGLIIAWAVHAGPWS